MLRKRKQNILKGILTSTIDNRAPDNPIEYVKYIEKHHRKMTRQQKNEYKTWAMACTNKKDIDFIMLTYAICDNLNRDEVIIIYNNLINLINDSTNYKKCACLMANIKKYYPQYIKEIDMDKIADVIKQQLNGNYIDSNTIYSIVVLFSLRIYELDRKLIMALVITGKLLEFSENIFADHSTYYSPKMLFKESLIGDYENLSAESLLYYYRIPKDVQLGINI